METTKNKIEAWNKALSLGQRSFLLDCMVKVFGYLTPEYKNEIWDLSEFITDRKYKDLLILYYAWFNGKGQDKWLAENKLKRMLDDLILMKG